MKAEIEFDGKDAKKKENQFRQKCEDIKFVADCLGRYQRWRMGEGEYGWSPDPEKNVPPPLCPKALTIVIDEAIAIIKDCGRILDDLKEGENG